MSPRSIHTLYASPIHHLALQAASLLLVLSLAWPSHVLIATPLDWQLTCLAVGGTAFVLASIGRNPWWWRLIHLIFAPLAWTVARIEIDPGWFLVAFVVLLLVFRGAVTHRVPLFLSGTAAVEAIAELIKTRQTQDFLDLGAGIGSIVVPLARRFPRVRFVAIENSVIPWLVGWARTRALANCEWRWGSLWAIDLRPFDLIYAYLSPAVMQPLGKRLAAEMKPGGLFVSNSFEIPDLVPRFVVQADNGHIYGYFADDCPRTATTAKA